MKLGLALGAVALLCAAALKADPTAAAGLSPTASSAALPVTGTGAVSATAGVSGTAGVSPTAASDIPAGYSAAPTSLPQGIAGQSGVEFCFGATALSVFNGSPLSYTPFEIGWRFSNGLHVRSGIDIFYYEGPDSDAKLPDQGVQTYSYEMQDWRTSLLYTVPLPGRLRPIAGMTLDVVQGTRKLAGVDQVNPPVQSSWGFLGPGAELGGEWRFTDHWAAELLGRYTFSFGAPGTVSSLGLNGAYLF